MKKHPFFVLMAFAVALTAASCSQPKDLRLMYWNIANGMWDGQTDHYDRFVAYVKSWKPDICVWTEAQTIYVTGTETECDTADRYLVKHWDELAARYGHKCVYVGGHRDDYPQVITSRFPIENVARIVGAEPDSVVVHGAGWARIRFAGKTLNIVTMHNYPFDYSYGVPKGQRDSSMAVRGGDRYRAIETDYVCRHTIGTDPDAAAGYWMLLGDFNSFSPLDIDTNPYYKWKESDPRFLAQSYVLEKTPFIDIVREKHPAEMLSTWLTWQRIDYVYCTKPLSDRVLRADIIKDEYANPVRDPDFDFYHPSDHQPILVDFRF